MRFVLLTGFLLLAAACGDEAEILLSVDSGDEAATADVLSLQFVVVAEGAVPQLFGPLPRDQNNARLPTAVPFNVRFYIDVFGCPDTGRCNSALAIARGCSAVEVIAEGDPQRVFQVDLVAVEDAVCPPEFN